MAVCLDAATARVEHRSWRRYSHAVGAVLLVLASSLFGVPSWAANCYGYTGGSVNADLFWNSVSEEKLRYCIAKHGIDAKGHLIGSTPLHRAAVYATDPVVIAALIEAGADLEARDQFERTPLHAGVQFGNHHSMVDAPIEAGANLEARDASLNSPALSSLWYEIYGRTTAHQFPTLRREMDRLCRRL